MNKLYALTKIQLKDFMSKYTQQLNMKSKILSKLVILLPIAIFLPAFEIIQQLYASFSAIGMPELTLTYTYVAATMLIFITAIPLVISLFFYSKDLSLIATLPVKEDTVIFSKIAAIYVYLFAIALLIFGTSVGFYGIYDGFKPLELILGIFGIILTPIMPMIFATLVVIPFMTFIGGRKNRNLMVILGNILLIALILGMQVVFTRVQMDPASMQKYLSSSDGILSLVGSKFPPSVWLTKMITKSWMDMLYYLLLNLGFVAVLKLTAKHLYKGAMLKYNQQSSQGNVNKKGKISYRSSSKRLLLIKRHLGIIIHNPTFLLNSVMTMFVPILLFAIYSMMGIMSLDTFKDPMLKPFAIYIYTGIISAPVLMGSLSTTVITREGKTFWQTRVLPISINENLLTRILSTFVVSFGASLVLAVLSFWILPLGPIDILLSIVFSLAATLCFSTMDLIINILRPFLNWSNPTAAVKNNLNIMISFLPRLAFGLIGFVLFKLLPSVGGQFMVAIFSVVLLIGFIASYALVFGRIRARFIDMDI
ncbi:putative ABC transporter permease subunit [Fusibacter bizertensis]